MNGVKEKFDNSDVQLIFADYDILVIMETHFKVRHKCPLDFYLAGRSVNMCTTTGRRGVAVYVKRTLTDLCAGQIVLPPSPPRAPPGTSLFLLLPRGSYHLNFYLPRPI